MDWSKLVNEIIESGMSATDIAIYCKTSTLAIHKLKTGKTSQPMADLGLKLVELNKKVLRARKND